jgi:hypothetical protein
MTLKVFNLINMIPHSVHLVNPIEHGNIANNERVGKLWDELEIFIQEKEEKKSKKRHL